MKKKLIIFIILATLISSIFAEPIYSRYGYYTLRWGSTVEDAKEAGYTLEKLSPEMTANFYVTTVDGYVVKNKDKDVKLRVFYYYKNSLFEINESLKFNSQKKLEARYGSFKDNAIRRTSNNQFGDALIDENGNMTFMSIMLLLRSDGGTTAKLVDWKVYKKVSITGREVSGISSATIVENLSSIAKKVVKDGKNGQKPSYAFLNLTSDNKDSMTEAYVTDALTEAVFNTGKVKVIERSNLAKILREQKFQTSGLVDEETAKEVGKIAGVDYVCYGTLNDVEDSIFVNVRVVDVETGEVIAMARDSIIKDDFILRNSKPTSSTKTIASSTTNKTTTAKNSVKSLWTVKKVRNNFDESTVYTFIVKGSDSNKNCFFGYVKNDIPSKSIVRAGFFWNDWSETAGLYDIKGTNVNVSKKLYDYYNWYYDRGIEKGSGDHTSYSAKKGESARQIVELFGNSDFVSVRHRDVVQRFQTEGFWETLEKNGITREEIEAAISNEEF